MRISSPIPVSLLACLILALAGLAWAVQEQSAKPAEAQKTAESPAPADVTTKGSVEASGQRIDFTAVAGTITVGATDAEDAQLGPEGRPQPGSQLALSEPKNPAEAPPVAQMFYVAYLKNGANAEGRPVTFFYNGGPGSSTMWLHLGSLGPKHVVTNGDTHLPAAPYQLVDNPDCLLDVSDEVFIDMPGTGFGGLAGRDAEKAFWGVDQDAGAFARFIVRFLTKYNRWNSPKYIFGESYGTTRSAVLANVLEKGKSVDLNGVILLSQIFNFTSDIDAAKRNPGVDLPYVLALPTFAATAWYHKKLPQQPAALEPFLKEVEDFALGGYMHALALGTGLSDAEKQQVAEKLHAYTSLPAAYWMKADLRVNGGEFEKTFEDTEDMTTGRYDTRFLGPTIDPLSEGSEYDPQDAAISSAYTALINSYLRNDLKYGAGQTYVPQALFDGVHWDWTRHEQEGGFGSAGGTNVSADLADAMKTNPHLKVMVNGGYYDMATPFFGAMYEEEHLPIPASLAKNIEYDWYESGHMVYVREECRKQLHDRVAAFIRGSESGSE